MDITDALNFVDRLVVEKTGKHLDDVQKTVIEGIWQKQSYQEIAEECHRSRGHVADTASKLFQLLSEALGEDFKKNNFRYVLEKKYCVKSSKNPQVLDSNSVCGNNNFVLNIVNQPEQKNKKYQTSRSKISHYDLNLAPKIIKFYNREAELKKIEDWLFNDNTSFVSVLGVSGIGKSYLVKRFVDLNLDKFEVIIWKSFQYPPPFNSLLDDILNLCDQKSNPDKNYKIEQILAILRQRKCLLVFDNVENLFMPGELAGEYQARYQEHQQFFQTLIETEHQSHLILISQEKCKEMVSLDEKTFSIKSLELSGINHTEIFKDLGLRDQDCWTQLQELYEGNPAYLQLIGNCINNIYGGSVKEFLDENTLIIPKDIEFMLQAVFHKLSSQERMILQQLCQSDRLLLRQELRKQLDISPTDLINALESLQNRYLLRKIDTDKIRFKLSPVFREYVQMLSVPIG